MSTLRVGTRGSDLALTQTGWVSDRLRSAHPGLDIERQIIKTHGDVATGQRFDADWPVGGFVGAIEQALAKHEIDFAVHSYKDLPTASTPGLVVAAVPEREAVQDVLVTREAVNLDTLSPGFRIGTSSPRRAAQLRRLGDIEIVPIRGNVPTRVAKVQGDTMDAVVLAAAGLARLGIEVVPRIDLPVDRFAPSPAQGALAIQTRDDDGARNIVKVLDHPSTRRMVAAERAFLKAINAGCHVPVGALASLDGDRVTLRGQLFSEDEARMAEGVETGNEPRVVGETLARRLLAELG